MNDYILELKTRTLEYAHCPACGTLMDGKEDGHEAGRLRSSKEANV